MLHTCVHQIYTCCIFLLTWCAILHSCLWYNLFHCCSSWKEMAQGWLIRCGILGFKSFHVYTHTIKNIYYWFLPPLGEYIYTFPFTPDYAWKGFFISIDVVIRCARVTFYTMDIARKMIIIFYSVVRRQSYYTKKCRLIRRDIISHSINIICMVIIVPFVALKHGIRIMNIYYK